MRKIEFRGKHLGTKKWCYGYLIQNEDGKVFIKDSDYEVNNGRPDLIPKRVIPETVGQFTGKLDAMKNKIFEGDKLGRWPHGDSYVYWDEEHACFACRATEDDEDLNEEYGLLDNVMNDCDYTLIVIGNIHEKVKLCTNCGTPAEKRGEDYWCKLCHNEM